MPLRTYERSEYKGNRAFEIEVFLRTLKQPWNPPWCASCSDTFYTPAYRSRYEKILTDDDGPKTAYKPCQHYKRWIGYDRSYRHGIRWTCRNGTEIPHYTSDQRYNPHIAWSNNVPIIKYGPWGDHVKDLPGIITSTPGSFNFLSEPPNLDQLTTHALSVMLPGIKAEFSAINFVLELKDLESLPNTLGRLRDLASRCAHAVIRKVPGKSKFIRKLRGTFSDLSGPTMAQAVRTGADSYLATEFAVKPLLSDLCGIYTIVDTLTRRINDLIARQGKRQTRHFSTSFYVPQYFGSPTVSSSFNLSTGQFAGDFTITGEPGQLPAQKWLRMALRVGREVYLTKAEFHAQMQFNYQLNAFQNANAQLLGALDAMGVNLNPAIIWNAIPWSFVVDWFVNIGSLLDSIKTRNLEPTVNITQYLWSWRFRRHVRTYVESTGSVIAGAEKLPRVYLKELYEEAYRRDVGVPSSNPVILDGLTAKQVSLGVALLIPRRKRSNWRHNQALSQ